MPAVDAALLRVRVATRARANEVAGWRAGALCVRVAAAPVDGEANRAVVDVLARAFGVARGEVALVRGAGSPDKLFRVGRFTLDELRARVPGPRS